MKKRRNDGFLIAGLLLSALFILLFSLHMRENGAFVIVSVDGAFYGKYPLSQDAEIPIRTGENYNLLVIQDKSAYIKEASCKNQVCVHQGKIRYDGQSIICLPNKVVVTVSGGEKQKVDAVSG